MADFMMLEDIVKMAKAHPDSFFIPGDVERKSQKIGDSVRLHFLLKDPSADEPQAERMWVTVTRTCGLFKPYKGVLENAPVYIQNLAPGQEIEFKPCNIAQTIIKKGDPRWIDSAEKKALVSEMCFKPDECVRFLYREEADREEDSGWRMFTGHESPEYNDDPKNIRIVVVGYMLDKDPTLLEPLKGGLGSVFERDDISASWRKVEDWKPED